MPSLAWRVAVSVIALIVAILIKPAFAADDYPSRAVRILIPFTPGGTADTLGRIAAQKLSESLGQQFVPENRPGGGGLIAAEVTAQAPPDGYSLIVSGVGGFIIVSAVTPKPPVDIVKDFTHIALLGGPPSVLVVTPNFPAANLKEFVEVARKRPGEINYGSPSAGSHSALIADLFAQRAGVKLTHVPYRGASQALTDMLGGHLPVASMTLTAAGAQIAAGKVRALAISSPQRVADFPDIRTYSEQGFPEIVAVTWFALSGPANLPPDISAKLNAEVIKAFRQPDVQERLKREAIYNEPFTPVQFTDFFVREMNRWTPIAKAVGSAPQ